MGWNACCHIHGDVVSSLHDIFHSCHAGCGYEVRGNGEMFPLNGPCWSLFFEYIGNILYALFIRRLSNKALTVFVVLLGVALAAFAVFNVSTYGNIGVGWTLEGVNFWAVPYVCFSLFRWVCLCRVISSL